MFGPFGSFRSFGDVLTVRSVRMGGDSEFGTFDLRQFARSGDGAK
jgi:hypothetical protein